MMAHIVMVGFPKCVYTLGGHSAGNQQSHNENIGNAKDETNVKSSEMKITAQ